MVMQMSAVTYGDLKIKAPYDIVALLDFKLVKKVGGHGEVYLKAVVSDDYQKKYPDLAQYREHIEVFQMDGEKEVRCLFKGTVTELEIRFSSGNYHMIAKGLSHSYQMDKAVRSRSFQKRDMTYTELVREVIGGYAQSDFIDLAAGSRTLDEFTMQYRETDWQFLGRMASRFYTGLVADVTSDKPRFWFGISRGELKGTLKGSNYLTGRHAAESGKAMANARWGDANEREFLYYEVESDQYFEIGDVVLFRNKALVIERATASIKRQVLKYDYVLVPESGLKRSRAFNPHLSGTSLEGKVIEVKDENVRVHLNFDPKQNKDTAFWFPYPTYYTSDNGVGWHCMPELGDTVHLYFPSREEKDAVVSHSLRKHIRGGDKISDPHIKRLRTRGSKEARFAPKETTLTSKGDNFFIKLNEETGVELYSKGSMVFAAGEDLVMHGKQLEITAAKEISVSSKTSHIRLDGENHIKGSRVLTTPLPDEEVAAYASLQQEMNGGSNYPGWAQPLLLKYKADYYRAKAAGDEKGMKAAAENAKKIRDKIDEIHAMPPWAQEQMNENTEKWYEAHAAGNKAEQDYYHGAANSLRDKVQMIALIRNSSAESYKDANRLEELTQRYADAKNKLTTEDPASISKSADEIRAKYGVSHRAARESLNLLAKKFPNDFKYNLDVKDEWDSSLNNALYDFSVKYGLAGKVHTKELLEAYAYQVANGILPWPKPQEKSGSGSAPAAKPSPGNDQANEKKPSSTTDVKKDNNGQQIVADHRIASYVTDHKELRDNQKTALERINSYYSDQVIQAALKKNPDIPLVFFFERVGNNGGTDGRHGALGVVVKGGEVKATFQNTSTLPTYGNQKGIATVKAGVYEFVSGLHRKEYPALRVRDGAGVPATYPNDTNKTTAVGINVHMGFSSGPSSEGCLTIQSDDYTRFLKAVGVLNQNAPNYVQSDYHKSGKNVPSNIPYNILNGIVIIDRKD